MAANKLIDEPAIKEILQILRKEKILDNIAVIDEAFVRLIIRAYTGFLRISDLERNNHASK